MARGVSGQGTSCGQPLTPQAPAWVNNLTQPSSKVSSSDMTKPSQAVATFPSARPAAAGEAHQERMVLTPNFKRKQILAGTLSADCSPSHAGSAEITPLKSKGKTCPKLDFGSPCILSLPCHPSSTHGNLPSPSRDIPPFLTLKEFITEECEKITAKSFCVTGKSLQH